LVVGGIERKLRIFDVGSGALLAELETLAPVQTISVDPHSGQLITGDQAGVLTVRDLKTGRAEVAWQAHADWILGSAVSADGTQLASAGADRLVRVWNLRTHQRLHSLAGHGAKVLSVDFSSDGKQLASAGEDKTVRIWSPLTGVALAILPGHTANVRAVRFTQRASLLASGSDDGTIRLWHLDDLTRPAMDLEANLNRRFGLEATRTPAEPESLPLGSPR
jgi:WD40 repeat protein